MVIYGLRCPINHCIMYVGQTGHLRTRVVNHLCLGRRGFKGKAKAAEAIGIPAHVFARKIQPIMDDLGESERNPGIASDIFYDPIALDRWKAFLAQLDRRGGRAKMLDYRSLYLAWLEGHNK